MPLAKAINVDVACVSLTLTGGDHRVGGRVFLIETHVAGGNVVAESGRIAARDGPLARGVVVGIFCEILGYKTNRSACQYCEWMKKQGFEKI